MESLAATAPAVAFVAAGADLEQFYRAELPRLVGALTLYCGDRELAAELAQEAMTRAWRHWSRVGRLDSPRAWVYRVGVNLANSAWRRAVLRHRLPAAVEAAPEHDVGGAVAVRAAVAALPRRQRTALVLRYFVDLPAAEVAVLMRCTPETVRGLTHQAIRNLRERSGLTEIEEETS